MSKTTDYIFMCAADAGVSVEEFLFAMEEIKRQEREAILFGDIDDVEFEEVNDVCCD